jgi:hypothetical protein
MNALARERLLDEGAVADRLRLVKRRFTCRWTAKVLGLCTMCLTPGVPNMYR